MTLAYTQNPSVIVVVETGELVAVSNENARYIDLITQEGDPYPYFFISPSEKPEVLVRKSYNARLRMKADELFKSGNVYDAVRLLLKAERN